jgi:hypothetical protein
VITIARRKGICHSVLFKLLMVVVMVVVVRVRRMLRRVKMMVVWKLACAVRQRITPAYVYVHPVSFAAQHSTAPHYINVFLESC